MSAVSVMASVNKYVSEEQMAKIKTILTYAALALGMIVLMMVAQEVLAGTDGDEFSEVWDTLEGWTQGTLGRIISIAFVLIGAVMGAARQSLMAFAVGIASALGLFYSPNLIDNIFTATLPLIG